VRRQRVREAYLYDRRIDATTYQEETDRWEREISDVQIEMSRLRDGERDDVQQLLTFGVAVLSNAANTWRGLESPYKQRFQELLFPAGVQYSDGKIGTTATNCFFSDLGASQGETNGLASPPGLPVLYLEGPLAA
jgi:hypothetical protein